MPYASTSDPWKCLFARVDLVKKFFPNGDIPKATDEDLLSNPSKDQVIAKDNEKGISTADVVAQAKDDRALFYMGIGGCSEKVRTLTPGDAITGPLNGASFVKWTNLHADGTAQHHQNFSDTDFPMFRLAEIYLTRAEAKFRLNGSQDGLADIKLVQDRANRAPDLQATSVDNQTLIDEWCREFYMEGRRRSDLVRFGLFTGSKYLWSFKGGSENGQGIPTKFDIYPIPGDEMKNNPNMTQNPKY